MNDSVLKIPIEPKTVGDRLVEHIEFFRAQTSEALRPIEDGTFSRAVQRYWAVAENFGPAAAQASEDEVHSAGTLYLKAVDEGNVIGKLREFADKRNLGMLFFFLMGMDERDRLVVMCAVTRLIKEGRI
jgi:hypothetical protein